MPELATNDEWRGIMARARKAKDLKQDELAAKVGITQVMISKLESGAATSSTYILRICRALDIPPPEHFESEDQKAWSQLGRLLRLRKPEQYKATLTLVESLVKEQPDVASEEASNLAPAADSDSASTRK